MTVCANKNKPFTKQTNRLLVPHTLTKKEPSKSSNSKTSDKLSVHTSVIVKDPLKPSSGLGLLQSDDASDNEEEEHTSSVSFFSLNENPDPCLDMKLSEPGLDSNNSISKSETKTSDIVDKEGGVLKTRVNDVYEKPSVIKKAPSRLEKPPSSKSNVNFGSTKTNDFFKTLVSGSNKTQSSNVMAGNLKSSTLSSSKPMKPETSNKGISENLIAKSKLSQYSDVTGPYKKEVTGPYSDVTGPYRNSNSVTASYPPSDSVTGSYRSPSAVYGSAVTRVNSAAGDTPADGQQYTASYPQFEVRGSIEFNSHKIDYSYFDDRSPFFQHRFLGRTQITCFL